MHTLGVTQKVSMSPGEEPTRVLRHRCATFAAIAAAACVNPAAASAWDVGFQFSQYENGTALIAAQGSTGPIVHHLDLVRNGAVIATSPTTGFYALLDVPSLLAGDVARFYDGNAVSATAAYDGEPTIASDACAPHGSFTATRSDTHTVYNAGAFPADDYTAVNRAINTAGNPFTVTLQNPLAVGDIAFVVTQGLQSNGRVGVEFVRYATVAACPAPSSPARAARRPRPRPRPRRPSPWRRPHRPTRTCWQTSRQPSRPPRPR
jgi:hypothetical protein